MIVAKPNLEYVTKMCVQFFEKLGSQTSIIALSNTFKKIIYHEKADDSINTLALDKDENLHINLPFWQEHIKTDADATFVLIHELMHHVLGDITRLNNLSVEDKMDAQLINIAADIRINAFICTCLNITRPEGYTTLFIEKFYESKGVEGLLRPKSNLKNTKFYKLYQNVWFSSYGYRVDEPESIENYDDLYTALKVILNRKIKNVKLIGTHSQTVDGKPTQQSNAAAEKIGKILKESIESGMGGRDTLVGRLILEDLAINQSLSTKIFARYAINKKLNNLKSFFPQQKKTRQPIPTSPSKRDLFLVSIGQTPTIWNSRKTIVNQKNTGVAVYLDVSGSVYSFLPRICALISKIRKELNVVYGFSNKVIEHTVEQIRKGIIESTGGTDFDCVAEHILDNKITKAIIFTDGYASISKEYANSLRKNLSKAALILLNKRDNRENFFSQYYDTYNLDELIK